MKSKFSRGVILGLALAGAPFGGGCKNGASTALAETVAPAPTVETAPNSPTGFASASVSASTAPVKAEPALSIVEKAAPTDVKLSSNAGEIVKLAQAGVDETIMLSFITNSTGTFNLGSEEIIYLNDLGIENSIITAMIEHDRVLVAVSQSATTAATPTTAAPSAAVATEAPYAAPATETAYVAAPTEPVTVNYFYSSLAPYGSWVEVDGYGRCWQPTVAVLQPTWQPYCDRGHWVYTDCGWYWYSDYSWGYNTFHYGRWFRHPRYGWCWNPDTVWGPAWVTWRYSNDYCGWAPLPPRCDYRPGVGFSYYGHSVGFSFNFGLNADCYTFVPFNRFCDSRPYRYRAPRNHVTAIYNNTTIINNFGSGNNNTVINHGIPVERVSAAMHTKIHQISTRETSSHPRRGEQVQRSGNETVIFRPVDSSSRVTSTQRGGGTLQTGSNAKSVLPKAGPPEGRRGSESVSSTTSTARPSVLPKANPRGEQTHSESTGLTTTSTKKPGVLPKAGVTGERRSSGSTVTSSTENRAAASTVTVIGSRERQENERHQSVQPKTAPAAVNQTAPATSTKRETVPPNALIFRGNRERSQASSTPSVQPPTETRTVRSATVNPTPTVAAPSPSVLPRVEKQEAVRSTPTVSQRIERQENYRPAPSIPPRVEQRPEPTITPRVIDRPQTYRSSGESPRQSENIYSAPAGRSNPGGQAPQSVRPQVPQSQSRGNAQPRESRGNQGSERSQSNKERP